MNGNSLMKDPETARNELLRAVEMTAECEAVEYVPGGPVREGRWTAELWSTAHGCWVVGRGATAWAAVQDAHDKRNKLIDDAR